MVGFCAHYLIMKVQKPRTYCLKIRFDPALKTDNSENHFTTQKTNDSTLSRDSFGDT